jgi:transmembrane sensor
MTREEYYILADKIVSGAATEQDVALYNAWFNQYQASYDIWKNLPAEQRQEMLEETKTTIDNYLGVSVAPRRAKLWPRIAVAAAAVAAIILGTWLYVNEIASSQKAPRNDGVVMNDIAPGKNTATLTLANGKTINLSDAKTGVTIDASTLTYNDGTSVTSSSRGTEGTLGHADSRDPSAVGMTRVATPRGGTYQVTLPDGTRVWLNADSKIEFPSQFNGAQRKIILAGEAYFEVSHNKSKPFVVQTDKQEVTVLGTHFNINSYADEGSTKTTLLEGSVSVSSLLSSSSLRGRTEESRGNLPGRGPSTTQREATILKPNQQSILTDNRIKVETVDPADALAWKSGLFVFNNEELESVMRKISRWYNVDVQYAKGANTSEVFAGSINRFENVSRILEMLEKAGDVKFKIEGRTIIVQ